MTPVHLARINYAGDLGYELWVAPEYQRELFDRIVAAGEPHGLRLFGMRALMSLRLEKSYGTWFREYRPIYTPLEGGITRYLKLDHEFIGRAAHEAEAAAGGPARRLVAFVVEPGPGRSGRCHRRRADLARRRGRRLGDLRRLRASRRSSRSRSGYVPTELATRTAPAATGFEIEIIGRRRPARLQPRAAVRPAGSPDAPVTEAVPAARLVADGRPDRRRRSAGARSRRATRSRSRSCGAGEVPGRGGTLCLAGDCGNCLAQVDGIAYVRTCQTAGPAGVAGRRGIRPAAMPPLPVVAAADLTRRRCAATVEVRPSRGRRRGHRRRVERAGRGGRRGTGRQERPRPGRAAPATRSWRSTPARSIVVRTPTGMLHVHAHEIVVATGAAEIHPVCPGQRPGRDS